MKLPLTWRATRLVLPSIARKLSSNSVSNQPFFEPPKEEWDDQILLGLTKSLRLLPDFITNDEEQNLVHEVEPHLKRLVYEKDHWDEAIVNFRETERKHWNPANSAVIKRLQTVAFDENDRLLPYVHVLDLAQSGHIKPHIDSSRFCGNTVAVLSLLSDCVLRLMHDKHKDLTASYVIPRRSLYVMKGSSRYDFSHEILSHDAGKALGILKTRRISIVCRNEVEPK